MTSNPKQFSTLGKAAVCIVKTGKQDRNSWEGIVHSVVEKCMQKSVGP